MTVQQEAYQMIDKLSDNAVAALIHIMRCMVSNDASPAEAPAKRKRKAYLRLTELRKDMTMYDFSETDRAEGLEEKYGTY